MFAFQSDTSAGQELAIGRRNCRHDGQRPSVGVIEERHPLLGAIVMSVDHMWGVNELDAIVDQPFVCGMDIRYVQIDQ